jgi:hypothetical protein
MVRKNCAIGVALMLAGCAHVTGAVDVDGAEFAPTMCRSGQAIGFSGVELADTRGQRMRLARSLNGTAVAVYFPPGSEVGDDLGACVTMYVWPSVGTVNGIRNVEGNASLACNAEKHQVVGWFHFENCH